MRCSADHGRSRHGRAASTAVAALAVILARFTGPQCAMAEPDETTAALCSDDSTGCAIEFEPVSREGAFYESTVRGAPGTPVSVQAYLVRLDGDRIESLEPFSEPQRAVLNQQGVARVGVALGRLPDDETGGFLLISLEGARSVDVGQMIGAFSVFGAISPMLLGDAYGEQKPVGHVLDLQYFAAMPYARFAVDYQDDSGGWHEATAPEQPGDVAQSPDAIGHVRYMVPRGLQQKPYRFRLRNISVNETVATWTVVPSLSPPTQDRLTVWDPPEVGSAIGNAVVAPSRDSDAVRVGAAIVAAAAVGAAAVPGVVTAHRRRLLRRRPEDVTS